MANLAQLSAIRGAVRGWDQGEMKEEELQKWLINFKEQQRQFGEQAGVQKGYLGIAKEDLQARKERRQEEKAKFDFEQAGRDLLESRGYHDIEANRAIGKIVADVEEQDIAKQLRAFELEALGKPEYREEAVAGALARARVGGLGVRGLTAEVEEKEYAATITGAQANVADTIAQLSVMAAKYGIQKDRLELRILQDNWEAMPLERQAKLDFMNSQINRMNAATNSAEFELALNQALEETTILTAQRHAEAIGVQNNLTEERIKALGIELAQRDRELGMMLQKLDAELRNAPEPYSDSRRNRVLGIVATTVNDMMLQVPKDTDDAESRFLQWDSLRKLADATLMSIGKIGVWETGTAPTKKERRVEAGLKEARFYWWDSETPKFVPPKLLGFRDITQEEKAEVLRSPGTVMPPRTGRETIETKTLTQGIKQQYVDRLKAATTTEEDDKIKSDYTNAGYPQSDWAKIVDEGLR